LFGRRRGRGRGKENGGRVNNLEISFVFVKMA
jgi:hypothetical protein